jgi:hypothetical protein
MRAHLPDNLKFHFFFDRELGVDEEFTRTAIEAASGEGLAAVEFTVFDAESGAVLAEKTKGQDPAEIFRFVRELVQDAQQQVLGVSFVGRDRDWYLHQDTPVSLGVLGCTIRNRSTKNEDFLSCEEIKGWDAQRVKGFELFYGEGSYRSVVSQFCSRRAN